MTPESISNRHRLDVYAAIKEEGGEIQVWQNFPAGGEAFAIYVNDGEGAWVGVVDGDLCLDRQYLVAARLLAHHLLHGRAEYVFFRDGEATCGGWNEEEEWVKRFAAPRAGAA